VHDLEDSEKHCITCQQDLRPIGEECSERYEYIPAQLTVIEDVCRKYACACTVKTATKPPQPIEKSTAGASLLAQVIVAKTVDHLPLNRQEKIFERHGVEISRKTMCGWMAQCAHLLQPLYGSLKEVLFQSRVIGTDDTSVKVQGGKTAAVLRTLGVLPTCWSRSLPLAQGCAFTDRHASDHPDRRVTAAQLGARPRLTLIGFSPIARAGLSPVLLVILGRLLISASVVGDVRIIIHHRLFIFHRHHGLFYTVVLVKLYSLPEYRFENTPNGFANGKKRENIS